MKEMDPVGGGGCVPAAPPPWIRQCVNLDFFLITDRTSQSVMHTDIIPGYKSDHSIPTLWMSFSNNDRAPGYWKFNTSLLDDQDFSE